MKRLLHETDAEFEARLSQRKKQAEYDMLVADIKNGFVTQQMIYAARREWKLASTAEGACIAENRLMSGEVPDCLNPLLK